MSAMASSPHRAVAALSLSPPDHDGLAAIAASHQAMIEQTLSWSRINSGSSHLAGLRAMAQTLMPSLHALPGELLVRDLPPTNSLLADGTERSQENGQGLHLQVRAQAPIQIALTGHYDTVFGAEHPFQAPLAEADGQIIGPGMADMKGGISVMLTALRAFEASPGAERVGYQVFLSPDEETGSLASASWLDRIGRESQIGLTYEPAMADGALAAARKGSGKFSLVIRGRAAHAGRDFASGRSALAAAARCVARLDGGNGKQDGVTFNIGRIDGGGPLNIVPDLAIIRFEARAPDAASRQWALDHIQHVLAAVQSEEGITAQLHGHFHRPPKPRTPEIEGLLDHAALCSRALGFDLHWRDTGGVCEGNNLAAAGCPNVDTLGPIGGNLHSSDEFVRVDSFVPRAQLSFLMLRSLVSGALIPPARRS